MKRDEPKSAAELFTGARAADRPTFDCWPPTDWFVGPDESTAGGGRFDWSPPPPGFSVELAYAWVGRVADLYRYWDAVNFSYSHQNRPSSSALSNAYLLVGDLRRRGLVPLGGFQIYRVPMDDCPVGFEARELAVVSDWLGGVLQQVPRTSTIRLAATPATGIVTVDGVQYQVGDEAASLVQGILDSGEWVSLKTLKSQVQKEYRLELSHPERTLKRLPKEVRDAIDVDQQRGHRIKPEYLG
ncbi:hypothetical protein [Gemmata sp.]|uniref:hypothetical protein n=1 Tax=Gemmata sp. TaxID=1914242 RepID=UPI003F723BF8